MPMTSPTLPQYRALDRVQRRKQGRGPMTPVIVGYAFDVAQAMGSIGWVRSSA
jgi:hypothetical protein